MAKRREIVASGVILGIVWSLIVNIFHQIEHLIRGEELLGFYVAVSFYMATRMME